jgi:hypothetical protein
MEVLEGQNILVTISGKKNKIRVYYLSWLNNKIFKKEAVSLNMYNYICSKLEHNFFFSKRVRVMVFNATFNNISVIS